MQTLLLRLTGLATTLLTWVANSRTSVKVLLRVSLICHRMPWITCGQPGCQRHSQPCPKPKVALRGPALLAVPKTFCVEAYTSPGFSCAAELGCRHVGRLPSLDAQFEGVLPEKATPTPKLPTAVADKCHELRTRAGMQEQRLGRLRSTNDKPFVQADVVGQHSEEWENASSSRGTSDAGPSTTTTPL